MIPGRRTQVAASVAIRLGSRALSQAAVLALALSLALIAPGAGAQAPQAPRMTGRYHFLGPEDTIWILQEEDLLKGYIDVFEGENESDAILSYSFVLGSRHGDRVDFTTRTIHEKFYRFSGTVRRGSGKNPRSPDYLQLDGQLDTVTLNSVTGEQKVQKQAVVFKSIPPGEGPPE